MWAIEEVDQDGPGLIEPMGNVQAGQILAVSYEGGSTIYGGAAATTRWVSGYSGGGTTIDDAAGATFTAAFDLNGTSFGATYSFYTTADGETEGITSSSTSSSVIDNVSIALEIGSTKTGSTSASLLTTVTSTGSLYSLTTSTEGYSIGTIPATSTYTSLTQVTFSTTASTTVSTQWSIDSTGGQAVQTLSQATTVGTAVTMQAMKGQTAKVTGYSFDNNEWAWVFTFSDSGDDGVFALEDIADPVVGNLWTPPTPAQSAVLQLEGVPTYEFQELGYSLISLPYTISIQDQTAVTISTTGYANATTFETFQSSGINGFNFDRLPVPTTTFSSTLNTTTFFTKSFSLATGTVGYDANSGSAISGFSIMVTDTITLWSLASIHGVSYDDDGDAIDSLLQETFVSYTTTAQRVAIDGTPLAPYPTVDQDEPTALASAAEAVTVLTQTAIGWDSWLPAWIVYEATFDPAFRFGSDGKCDRVIGPASNSCYYPFWSQQWSGLWTPMCYPKEKTVSWTGDRTDTTYYSDGGTGLTNTGPVSTVRFAWGFTGTASGQVSMTSSWQEKSTVTITTNGTTTTTTRGGPVETSSDSFEISTEDDNDASYYTTRGGGVGGSFAIGGEQWDGNDVSAGLGRGVWRVTTNDSTGGSASAQITVTDDMMFTTAASDQVLAFSPLPAYSIAGIIAVQPQFGVFGDQVTVADSKWSF